MKLYNFDDSLRKFYYSVNYNEKKVIVNYRFYSIKEIIDEYENATIENISKQFEIGYMCMGMGHTCILVYDPSVSKYYFRHGGGSSGGERLEIIKYFSGSNFVPSHIKYKYKVFDFENAMKQIMYDRTEEYMIMEY